MLNLQVEYPLLTLYPVPLTTQNLFANQLTWTLIVRSIVRCTDESNNSEIFEMLCEEITDLFSKHFGDIGAIAYYHL